jgi:hypothetical protein
MRKTTKKHVGDDFRNKIWSVFWRELGKTSSQVRTSEHLKRFLTETEIAILEKRLAALYWLNQGESLRETSKKSGLAKKAVIAVKHGFRKPIPRPMPMRETAPLSGRRPKRLRRAFSYRVSDKLINDLWRKR